MDLVDEKDSWDYFCFSLFSPFWDFLVNLLSYLLSNLSCGSWKQGQESLWSGVNDVDLMQRDSVDDFFSLLDLPFRTIYESGLRAHSIVLGGSGKASTGFWYFSWSLIDCYNVSGNDFLFLNSLYHLLTQIVDGLHFSGFKSDFSSFGSGCYDNWIFYLKTFRFQFIQLLLKLFRSIILFLRLLIFWKLEWEPRFLTFKAKIFTNRPTWWKAHLHLNF